MRAVIEDSNEPGLKAKDENLAPIQQDRYSTAAGSQVGHKLVDNPRVED